MSWMLCPFALECVLMLALPLSLFQARAKRLSDEASALPPVSSLGISYIFIRIDSFIETRL